LKTNKSSVLINDDQFEKGYISQIKIILSHELSYSNSNMNEEFNDHHRFEIKQKKLKRQFYVLVEKKEKEKDFMNYIDT